MQSRKKLKTREIVAQAKNLEERSTKRTTRSVRRIEPFEKTTSVKPVLTRTTRLGRQCPIGQGDDSVQLNWLLSRVIKQAEDDDVRITDSTLHNPIKMKRYVSLEHSQSFQYQSVLKNHQPRFSTVLTTIQKDERPTLEVIVC